MKRRIHVTPSVLHTDREAKLTTRIAGIFIFMPFRLALLWLVYLFAQIAYAEEISLKIIAINDFHGNLQSPGSFRANAHSPNVPSGGIDMLAGYIRRLKEKNPYHVVVSAGDLIGASPLISALFRDEGTIETMNRLGLEISAVGNHEFDKGTNELLRIQSGGCVAGDQNTCKGIPGTPFAGARFQYLAANVWDETTGKTILPAYSIKTYAGVPVAFIGLTLKDTPTIVAPSGIAGLRFSDEATTINALVRELQAHGIRSFVVLIHQGGQQIAKGIVDINGCQGDLEASAIKSIVRQLDDAVDLVISGHTHAAYVCRIGNSTGRKIPVTSALSYGRVLTDIDVTIDTVSKRIRHVHARNVVIDRSSSNISADPGIVAIVDHYAAMAAPVAQRVVGNITADITTTPDAAGESPLGDLIADSQLEATRESGGAVIAFMNTGGIRANLSYSTGTAGAVNGNITYGELFRIQPFGNSLVTMTLTGAQIKTLLEQQFKGCALDFPDGNSTGRSQNQILQVSKGFTYAWSPSEGIFNKIDAHSMKIGDVPVIPGQKYRVTANSFLAGGGGEFYEFTHGTERVGGPQDVDAFEVFLTTHPSVSPGPLDRIKVNQSSSF